MKASLEDRPAEISDMAKLILTARETGRIVHPVPSSHDDMLGHLTAPELEGDDVDRDLT